MSPDATAVFAANDAMALGLLKALHERGRRVPDDVSVVGFDDVPEAAYYWPGLTTVQLPSYDLGWTAANLLLDRIAGKEYPLRTVVLRSSLQVREPEATGATAAAT